MEITLKIEGMSCNHCVAAVKKALVETGGVKSAEVYLDKKCAEIVIDEGAVTIECLKNVIEDLGFDVID